MSDQSLDDELREILMERRNCKRDDCHIDHKPLPSGQVAKIKQVFAARIPKPKDETPAYMQGWDDCVAATREALGLASARPDVRKEVNNGEGEGESEA